MPLFRERRLKLQIPLRLIAELPQRTRSRFDFLNVPFNNYHLTAHVHGFQESARNDGGRYQLTKRAR